MERKRFEQVVKNMPDNSVKKSCYVLLEYLRSDYNSAVSKAEANKALQVIMSYAYETSKYDTFAEGHYCSSDCIFNDRDEFPFCPGMFTLQEGAKTLCKHYRNNL